jgi:tetratricopeptide (TPR) repeat protein
VSTQRKWLRRLLRLCAGTLVALLLLWGLMLLLMWHWVAKPPPLPPEAATPPPALEHRADRVYFGRNWFGRREGLPVLYLTGTPYEMGYANGILTQKLIHRQEGYIIQLMNRFVPQRWAQFLIKFVVVYKNRYLSQHIPPEYQLEILGLSRGCPDIYPQLGPYYHRMLNYHGAQDISYMMMHSFLIRGGCTSFGAWGPETAAGHLLTARNFDWEADPVFDEDRIVIICEPKDGIAFISLAWAGMAGCVSGMNREGVSVTVNGAPSHLPKDVATPTCLVAREILQRAHNLAEATAIVRRRQVFVSALFLVGSRNDGRFAVIEKTPERMAVREADGQPYIVCANHYLTPDLEGDPVNQEFKRVDTSLSRYERMKQLLQGAAGVLDPARCAAVLRDRRLPGGQFAGNGHRSSLNPLIATHSVIMDLTGGIFWAAAPPHQLGRFVAFDINDPEKLLPEQALAADSMLVGGDYELYLTAKAKLGEGFQALKRGDLDQAMDCAHQAEERNPGFYANSWLLAEVLFRQGKYPEATQACRKAQAGKPALAGERRRIQLLLEQVETHK